MEADRIAAAFADIPFDDHEARKLALAYQHLRGVNRWLRDDIDVKCETIARLEGRLCLTRQHRTPRRFGSR